MTLWLKFKLWQNLFLTSIDNMSLSDLDGESELIPLLTSEDEELLEKENH